MQSGTAGTAGTARTATARTAARRTRGAAGSGRPEPGTVQPAREPWRGRFARRDLYRRRVQRADEHWPLVTLALAAILRRPHIVLRILGAEEPLVREGRVLHPGLNALLRLSDRFGATEGGSPDRASLTVASMRKNLHRFAPAVMPVRTDVYVSGRYIDGPADAAPIGIRVYRRFGAGLGLTGGTGRLPGIVYFHGGGWVSGDLDTHDALCRLLAVASGCVVVSVDYRRAPEHPFPAAVDDALAAYRWVHEHCGELGIAEGQVGVMGDSAGGNLAAVVSRVTRAGQGGGGSAGQGAGRSRRGRAAREVGTPPPVAQGLVCPVLDARLDSETMRALADGFLLTRSTMEFYRDHYLPDHADWTNPTASPLLADDLSGLAPALVVTAGFDPLRDDGDRYADALGSAGVAVEHRRYEDQIHGFLNIGIVPDSLALATEICESMGRLMRDASTDTGDS